MSLTVPTRSRSRQLLCEIVIDMLNNIGAEKISLEMSAPNRAGIILPLDGTTEGENTLMLVMPVMLNN